MLDDATDRICIARPHRLDRFNRQMIECVKLRGRDRSEFEKELGEGFDAPGIVEFAPLRAQHRDFVAFVPHLGAQLGEVLSLNRRIELDAINVGRGQHQQTDYNEIEYAQDHRRPRIMTAPNKAKLNTREIKSGPS
jgi:hypothetical protein